MSILADEIVKYLGKRKKQRRFELSPTDVDDILADLQIPTSATKAVPVPLRATRIEFRGTKRLDLGQPNDGAVQSDADVQRELAPVPFEFEWSPQLGVNGIGSGRNLRGKSTILNVLMWSLTGRCARFQPDVQSWIEHVEVDWTVGAERLRVSFDAVDGRATGAVTKLGEVGSPDRPVLLGAFDGDEFESVIGHLMMNRLRMESIPVWTDTRATVHAWPSYSSALVVRANQLDPIVGNEQTIAIRMMQMFVGTDWAPALAAAATARRGMDSESSAASEKAKAAGEVLGATLKTARQHVADIKSKLDSLPTGTPDIGAVVRKANEASVLSLEIHKLKGELLAQSMVADSARQQLRAAKARVHSTHEDALATKFFHRMRPSVCPRCTAEVTTERQMAEPEKHECSVCSSDLNLDALEADVIVASSVSAEVTATLIAELASESDGRVEPEDALVEDESGPQDEIQAAEAAAEAAEAVAAKLSAQIEKVGADRDQALKVAESAGQTIAISDRRRNLELDLARAEGALAALTKSSDPQVGSPVEPERAAVVAAAEEVLKLWLKDGQDPLLHTISLEIEQLVASFGAGNIRHIKLDGAANMRLLKGGRPMSYSRITEGEKLRVKIATAIALIKHGFAENIGRHPGLLVLDSPAAEEMPDSDLATMLAALQDVAQEAEMQIFVATRNASNLLELLPATNRVVAEGDDYVW